MATPSSFVQQYGPLAAQVGQQIGVSPDLVLGQWGLETGWGKSVIPGTNNLGNIKGSGVSAVDNATGSNDQYRAYQDPQSFGSDYASLLQNRYPKATNVGDNATAFADALKSGGYAQDPQYASKLTGAINTVRKLGETLANAISGTAQAAEVSPKLANDPTWQLLQSSAGNQSNQPAAAAQNQAPVPDKLANDPTWQLLNATQAKEQQAPEQAAAAPMGQVESFASALGHHLMSLPTGAGQLGEHLVNAALQKLAPGSAAANYFQNVVNSDDAVIRAQEQQYQKNVPNNLGSYAGATIGEIIPALLSGGESMIAKGGEIGTSLAARLGLGEGLTNVLTKGGQALGGAALGGAFSAAQPVTGPGDYAPQKISQIEQGGILGGVMPSASELAAKLGGYGARSVASLFQPFSEQGRANIAANTILRAARGNPFTMNAGEIIPGSAPTLAEATGSPGIATLQRTVRDINPSPFVEREAQNQAARMGVLSDLIGTPEDLTKMKGARAENAADDFLSTNVGIPTSNTNYAQLKKTPAFQAAFSQAQNFAKNQGIPSLETMTQNKALANLGGAVGKPQMYVSGRGLAYVKSALDDQIDSAMRSGNTAQARNVLGVKDQLLNLMDSEIPGYADARAAYGAASKPIDAMQYLQGLNLTDAQGNVTLAKVQNALNGIQKLQQKPGINLAKSLAPEQIGALQSVRDDLLRAAKTEAGKTRAGSASAQNLATQNMLSSMLPGKVGAFASLLPRGSIGAALGGSAGYALGGPTGAILGTGIGEKAGSLLTQLMNTHNEAIQDQLAKLLLNPADASAALQRASATRLPITSNPTVQRFLYPSLISLGSGLPAGGQKP